VNVLPLARAAQPDEIVADAIRAEISLITAASQFQWLPTSEIVGLARSERSLAYTPLYQILFSQHDSPQPELFFGRWRPTVRELANGHKKTDLDVLVLNRGLQHSQSVGRCDQGAYTLFWEHDPAHYPGWVVASLMQRFVRLLDHACAHQDRPWPVRAVEWKRDSREWTAG
jgi:hypothetical protein